MPESERVHAKKDDKLTVLLLLAGSALSGLGLAGLGAAADILLCAGALLAGAGTALLLPARPAVSERTPAARVQRPQALPGRPQVWMRIDLDKGLALYLPGEKIEGILHVVSSRDLRCDEISCEIRGFESGAAGEPLYSARVQLSGSFSLPAWVRRSFRFSIDPPLLQRPSLLSALDSAECVLRFTLRAGAFRQTVEMPARFARPPSELQPPLTGAGRPKLPAPPLPPARETLEALVASVLEELGFAVYTNVERGTIHGSPVEVDVWAEGKGLTVYVSCKNWEKTVDRPVIDEEVGRVFSLREKPDLKVIVAPKFTRSAKAAARASGFAVAELGEKATEENAAEVYRRLYEFFKYQIAVHSASEAYRKRKGAAAREGGLL
jgi:hypothetical protein